MNAIDDVLFSGVSIIPKSCECYLNLNHMLAKCIGLGVYSSRTGPLPEAPTCIRSRVNNSQSVLGIE